MARTIRLISGAVTLSIMAYGATASAVDCFVDSVNGSDDATGQAEDQPVKTQAKLATLKSCTTVKYKRGSDFNEKVTIINGVKTYTNYGSCSDPLPKFHIQRSPNNGSMFNAMQIDGVTIDGLYLSGSMSDANMGNLMNGICVGLGSNAKLLNSEITNCDIGIMVFGTNSKVIGNYIHDLFISVDAAPGVDPNAVGGAEGIFINGSNNEVAYNSFIRCTSKADWTGGNCDGGATEVSVGAGKVLSGVRVHHNFSYQSCGFFEMSSMAGSSKGTFSDSEFYNNVSIDSGWLMLLQVNNTNTANVRWEQNTVVHRKATAINPGMLVTVFTGYSSGTSGGALTPNTVFLTNNYFVLDGFGSTDYINALDSALVIENSPIIKSPTQNAGFVNVAGDKASDFDLVAGSLAIDQGGSATTRTTDFLNRTMPAGSALDIGAFEYGASLGAGVTAPVAAELAVNGCAPAATTGGASATGGAGSTGGARATGGSSAKATGGAPAAAGAPGTGGALASGGALPNATGGAALGQGGAAPSAGGAPDAVGGAAPSGQGGVEANAGGVPPIAQVGDTGGTNAGPAPGSSLPVSNTAEKVAVDQSACSCRVQGQSSPTSLAGLLALLMLSMRPRRNRRLA